jgi:hypothetical protein
MFENNCYSYNMTMVYSCLESYVSLCFSVQLCVADTVIHSAFLYMKHYGIKIAMIFHMQFVMFIIICSISN